MSKQQTPERNGHMLLAVLWGSDSLDVAKDFPGNLSVVCQSFEHVDSDQEKAPLEFHGFPLCSPREKRFDLNQS